MKRVIDESKDTDQNYNYQRRIDDMQGEDR